MSMSDPDDAEEKRRRRMSGELSVVGEDEGVSLVDLRAQGAEGEGHYLEAELRERLRTDPELFDWLERAATDGLWFWDVERPENEWMSPGFKSLFGYRDDEIPMTSQWWQENIHPDDLPVVMENFQKHCDDESHPYDQVVRYRHKDGRTIWVRCRGYAFRDAAGTVRRMLGAHHDVTELMESRDELARSKAGLEERLGHTAVTLEEALEDLARAQAFSENMLAAIERPFVVLDRAAVVLRCNDAFRACFGEVVTTGQSLGRALHDGLAALAELAPGEPQRFEWAAPGAEPSVFHVSAYPVPHSAGARLLFFEDTTTRERAAEQREEARARLEDLYENAPDMYVSVDPATGLVRSCNRTIVSTTGFRKEEIIGKPVLDRYDEASIEDAKACFEQFRRLGYVKNAELLLKTKGSGPSIPVLLNVTAMRNADGEIVESRSVWRDIRERKKTEATLRRQAAMVAQVSDAIIATDDAGHILTFNPAAERLYGWAAIEVMGLPFDEVVRSQRVDADDAASDTIQLKDGVSRAERMQVRKDGTTIRVMQTTSLLRDDHGRPFGLVTCVRDITPERDATAALRLIGAVVDASEDAIVSTGPKGEVKSWSRGAETLFGRTEAEAIGTPLAELFEGPAQDAVAAAVRAAVGGMRMSLDDVVFGERTVSVRLSPLDFERQRGVAMVARDVTEQRHAQRQLEQAQRELEERSEALERVNAELRQFSGMVSHDLRAPLRAVEGYATLALERYGDEWDPKAQELVGKAIGGAKRMTELINGLLALARAGRDALRPRLVDMGGLVREAFNLASHGRKIDAELAMGDPFPSVVGDYTLLATVWANLIGNAVKYSAKSDSPVVSVRGWDEAGAMHYEVSDSGAGFDERFVGKLFQPFQRLHTASEFEGTGIGLAIVRRIVERHGGEVWARSPKGQGATFGFSIPLDLPVSEP